MTNQNLYNRFVGSNPKDKLAFAMTDLGWKLGNHRC